MEIEMQTWKLFKKTMRVMGKRRFLYYGAIMTMSICMALFSVMESLLMKNVVDIAQSGNYPQLAKTIFMNCSDGSSFFADLQAWCREI